MSTETKKFLMHLLSLLWKFIKKKQEVLFLKFMKGGTSKFMFYNTLIKDQN